MCCPQPQKVLLVLPSYYVVVEDNACVSFNMIYHNGMDLRKK